MKTQILFFILLLPVFVCGQSTFHYPLAADFEAFQPEGPELIQIPNNGGLYGQFITRTVPVSTCPDGGDADGYFFEDDAGLQFDNPVEFIDCEYSLSMIFQVDEFISPPPWVRLLSFTHFDDVGIYIYLTTPPDSGTLDFWPFGLVGEQNFFHPVDFYQLTLVRECSGMIKIYINGEVFSTYDDTLSQAYVPQDPNNFIMFFRDDPSVLADEASPGFVSNIIVSDFAWTEQMVIDQWDNFCPTLTSAPQSPEANLIWQLFPNPAQSVLYLEASPQMAANAIWRIVDVTGRLLKTGNLKIGTNEIGLAGFAPGTYILMTIGENGTSAKSFEVLPH